MPCYTATQASGLLVREEIGLLDSFGRSAHAHARNPMHACARTRGEVAELLRPFQHGAGIPAP